MFPRTTIENLSVSRLMMGSNWLMGYSHTSKAAGDRFIVDTVDAERVAEVLATGMRAGVDTFYGFRPDAKLVDGVKEAEQTTRGASAFSSLSPSLPIGGARPRIWARPSAYSINW